MSYLLSGPLDTKFCEGLDIPGTANTFVQGEIKTLSMDDWMKTSSKTTCHANLILISIKILISDHSSCRSESSFICLVV